MSLPYDLLTEEILLDERTAPEAGYPLGQGDEELLVRAQRANLKSAAPGNVCAGGRGKKPGSCPGSYSGGADRGEGLPDLDGGCKFPCPSSSLLRGY